MPSLTPNYSWNLPLVADPIDADLWGGQLNANISSQDTVIKAISDAASTAQALVDFGDLKATARSTAPAKWLLCYGQAISRTTYADLFAAIGTTYGAGDGSTTFNVLDARGRVLAGQDDMGGTSANRITVAGAGFDGDTLGAVGGSEFTQQHSHALTDPGHTHDFRPPSGAGGTPTFSGLGSGATSYGYIQSATTGITMADYGTGSSQNVQPTIVVNWLIYAGV